MSEDLVARARGALNPFLLDRVDSAWDGAFTDVATINRRAFDQCIHSIETVRATHQSRGLLLTGDPGSGKSHLLHRLRQTVVKSGKDYFVYVPPVAAAGTLFVELLRRVVGDILLQTHEGAATQLENLVYRALLQREPTVTASQLWNDMRRRFPPGPAMFDRLDRPFEQLVLRTRLDPDVARVLRHYLAGHQRLDAYRWLTAMSVPDEVIARLGVTYTLEEDGDARRALFALSGLAGRGSVFVLAFDQLEGMQLRADDLEGVLMFGSAVADLLINCRNIATVSCVQRYFYENLRQALPPAHTQRIAQDMGSISPLTKDEAVALVDSRLTDDPMLAQARSFLHEGPLWPIKCAEFQASLMPALDTGVPARTAINAARVLFDRWQFGAQDFASMAQSTGPAQTLHDLFERHQEAAAAQVPDESTFFDGLLKILDLKQPHRVRRSRLRGVNIEVDQPSGITGISVCQTQNMTSLAARLKQVAEALDAKQIHRAVLVRDARLPISATATATQTRLRALGDRGTALLRPGAAAYAAIAAARQLLAEATAGDLSVDGRTVNADEVRQWLLAEMPANLIDLVGQLENATGDATDEVLESLRVALDGRWILPLEVAAALSRTTLEAAHVRLTRGQSMVGYIAGPPAVVFMRPDGLPRT